MIIYIEYLILVNMLINFLLLKLSLAVLRKKIRAMLLLFSSGIGTAAAVLLPFIHSFEIPYKLAVLVLMIVIVERKSIKSYFTIMLTFAALTFLTGGIIEGLSNILGGDRIIVYLIVGAAAAYLVVYAFVRLLTGKKTEKYVYKCVLYFGGVPHEFTGYYDTGNKLFGDTFVTVISMDTGEDIIAKYGLTTGSLNVITVGGESKISTFKADKMVINNGYKTYTFNEVTLAVARTVFEKYKLLLHRDTFGG